MSQNIGISSNQGGRCYIRTGKRDHDDDDHHHHEHDDYHDHCDEGGGRDVGRGKCWRLQRICQTACRYHSQESIFCKYILWGIFYILFIFHNNIENNLSLLRNVLGTKKLGDILSERESIANEMQDLLREATEAWGVTVERVEVIQTNKQT